MAKVRIAMSVPTDQRWSRGALQPMHDLARRWDWELIFIPMAISRSSLPSDEMLKSVDGQIVNAFHRKPREDLPTVHFGYGPGTLKKNAFAAGSDQHAMGATAADYLIDRGFKSLIALSNGDTRAVPSRHRAEGFAAQGQRRNCKTIVFEKGRRQQESGVWTLGDQLLDFADAVRQLPRPVGILGVNPDHAWRAGLACREAGIRVPEEAAIISAAEDEWLLGASTPPISAVVENVPQVGRETMLLLRRLLEQPDMPPQKALVPPLGVHPRASTDTVAVADDDVRNAVRFIWDNVERQLQVADVVDHLAVSRTTLLRKFKRHLNRSPMDEIRNSRVETARRLLISTRMPLVEVAVAAGYGLQSSFSREFRAQTSQSPSELRQSHADQ